MHQVNFWHQEPPILLSVRARQKVSSTKESNKLGSHSFNATQPDPGAGERGSDAPLRPERAGVIGRSTNTSGKCVRPCATSLGLRALSTISAQLQLIVKTENLGHYQESSTLPNGAFPTYKIDDMSRSDSVPGQERDLYTQTDLLTSEELGYDPQPNVLQWHGTPIPPVYKPLPAIPQFVSIARKRWWNGDPWTILRNRDAFLKHAMDWTPHEEFLYLWENVPREDWVAMLSRVRPGEVSRRSYLLCTFLAGLLPFGSPPPEEWREDLHVKDMLYRDFRERRRA